MNVLVIYYLIIYVAPHLVQALSDAILAVTNMSTDMTVEKIEIQTQEAVDDTGSANGTLIW